MNSEFVEFLAAFPPLQFVNPAAQREAIVTVRATLPPVPWPAGVTREDRMVASPDGHEIPIRCYIPQHTAHATPTVLWIHGGGYCIGDPGEDEPFCAGLAAELGATVVSVAYRLAPEHPYPAALDDCYTVLLEIGASASTRYPTGSLVVAGMSAGGGLAAAVALRARDQGGPEIRGQVLLCPFLDATMSAASMTTLANAPVFNSVDARHCWEHYLGQALHLPPVYGSPSAATALSGLPQSYVLVAGEDCLRDEAIDYALRLQAAGVPTELHVVPNVPHAFTAMHPGATISRQLRAELITVLSRMTGGSV
jgi:acetyl esterase